VYERSAAITTRRPPFFVTFLLIIPLLGSNTTLIHVSEIYHSLGKTWRAKQCIVVMEAGPRKTNAMLTAS
jgi:hypothetical protein